jgi:hypothetical protein
MNAGIPTDVASFVQASFTSVEELELLTLLQARPEAVWTSSALAKELGSTPESISRRLAAFAALGIIAPPSSDDPPNIRYAPATTLLAGLLHGVALTYRQRRIAMVTMIYERPHDPLRSFADAFRLRKDGPR